MRRDREGEDTNDGDGGEGKTGEIGPKSVVPKCRLRAKKGMLLGVDGHFVERCGEMEELLCRAREERPARQRSLLLTALERSDEGCGTPHAQFSCKIDHYLFTVTVEALRQREAIRTLQIKPVLEHWMPTKSMK